MKKKFTDKRFQQKTLDLIAMANTIIAEFQADGFTLTLRQLYYQFVARGLIKNNMKSYKAMGNVINDARLAGLIDWYAIEDRTRYLRDLPHWSSGSSIINSCAAQFRKNKWERQDVRPEVWIEKDALIGVIDGICRKWDVPYFACRGYASQSEVFRAGERFQEYLDAGQRPIILHLGDHDPSGIDMTRDNETRLELFSEHPIEVRRLALNMDQVQQYNPPPNPAKQTDSRSDSYIDIHGTDSWELDALDPHVISDLIDTEIRKFVDMNRWQDVIDEEEDIKMSLRDTAAEYESKGI